VDPCSATVPMLMQSADSDEAPRCDLVAGA
jgi:hypothetical protein